MLPVLAAPDFAGDRLTWRDGTALVVFSADWCGYSAAFLNQARRAADALPVPIVIADVSEDENPLWDVFNVRLVPTVVLFKDGVAVWRADGRPGIGLEPGVFGAAAAALG